MVVGLFQGGCAMRIEKVRSEIERLEARLDEQRALRRWWAMREVGKGRSQADVARQAHVTRAAVSLWVRR